MQNYNSLTILSVLSAAKQSLLYLVTDGSSRYVLKTSRTAKDADKEAYLDEYESLKDMTHPVLPRYYACYPNLSLPENTESVPALLMEYIDGTPLSSLEHLTTKQLKKYILDLGDALLTLLLNGVLYTDLHPGNLIIENGHIRLIDLTRAYYFIRNPYPSYTPKMSYGLNQNLRGQQMLIQALTLLLTNLPEHFDTGTIPKNLIQLGLNPINSLSFADFLEQLRKEWIITDENEEG